MTDREPVEIMPVFIPVLCEAVVVTFCIAIVMLVVGIWGGS